MAEVVAAPVVHAESDSELVAATPSVSRWHPPVDVRVFLRLHALVERLQAVMAMSLVAGGLAALSERRRHAIDRCYYDRERMYHTARYNEQGLWDWERQVVEKYFVGCSSVAVTSAGGGREVIALRRMGLNVSAFECHANLAAFANTLLQRLGFSPVVLPAERDECPAFGATFGAAIIGWGAYMLIRGRQRRVRFLRAVRAQLEPNAPVLLSFMHRARDGRRFTITAAVANACRHLLGGERVEVGDFLVPNYVHFFSREEIDRELSEAGFALAFYSAAPYGHAVAHAR